jgi:hypothetical protein
MWGFVAVALLLLCLLATAFRTHSIGHSRSQSRVSIGLSRAAERLESGLSRAAEKIRAKASRYAASRAPQSIAEPVDDEDAALAVDRPPWTVTGRGETSADAFEYALEKARAKMTQYLRARTPTVQWTPSLHDMEQFVHGRRGDEVKDFGQGVGLVHEVSIRVDVTAQDLARVLKEDNRVQTEERLWSLLKGFAAVVALLAAVAGYIRADELSKGYYSAWLALAAAGFVAAAGVGLWFFPF